MERIGPFFPLAHGVPRVDDLCVLSGIVYVIRNGLQWKDGLVTVLCRYVISFTRLWPRK
ncbi:transposase, partial [Acetobacter sp. DmW_043]|uniref:transposase n=1 Tax=Acetobacter sp. DmW_043 TaxID=1670658 RepID=UPI003516DDAD